VAAAYERLAAAEPNRFTRLDATGSRDHIHIAVMARLQPLLDRLDKTAASRG
jgi:thymidylate kinase